MIYVCVSVCFMRVCLWFTSTAKAFLWGQKRFQAFIFPTEFTADLKKFSLEEKNRKKSFKQPHSQRDKLKLFQKYLLSRSFTLFAAFRSLFALISFYLVWLRISSRTRERKEYSALTSVLSFLQDRSEREKMAESGKFLSHTHKEGFCMARSFAVFFLRCCECEFLFLFVLVGLKN